MHPPAPQSKSPARAAAYLLHHRHSHKPAIAMCAQQAKPDGWLMSDSLSSRYPREIPTLPWYRSTLPQMAMAGLPPTVTLVPACLHDFVANCQSWPSSKNPSLQQWPPELHRVLLKLSCCHRLPALLGHLHRAVLHFRQVLHRNVSLIALVSQLMAFECAPKHGSDNPPAPHYSVWGHKVYTIYSILFIVFVILMVRTLSVCTQAFVPIPQNTKENHSRADA